MKAISYSSKKRNLVKILLAMFLALLASESQALCNVKTVGTSPWTFSSVIVVPSTFTSGTYSATQGFTGRVMFNTTNSTVKATTWETTGQGGFVLRNWTGTYAVGAGYNEPSACVLAIQLANPVPATTPSTVNFRVMLSNLVMSNTTLDHTAYRGHGIVTNAAYSGQVDFGSTVK